MHRRRQSGTTIWLTIWPALGPSPARSWAATRTMTFQAEWVLNHQFLRIHEKTAASAPTTERRYEATWFLGYDAASERYVLHLLNVFGGRYSETLGYGTRDGNAIRFVFEYPDGPFHTTYRWSPETGAWQWLLEQKDKDGKWTQFADFKLTRAAPKQ